MTHLDLFSGYAGFTIPAEKYGIETVGFSEIDKYASAVLKYNFRDIKNYGDITKLKGEDLPTVDIITGGSPCQDLSVAGKGAGLNAKRSGLFFHFIRVIREVQPTYFIWENVKGAFSSQRGWDFARVQIEMEQAGYDVWWQTLNAKDFGVPQNRERIFAVGIRKGSGREILLERVSTKQDITTNKREIRPLEFESTRRVYSSEGVAKTTDTSGTGLYVVRPSGDMVTTSKIKGFKEKEDVANALTATCYKGYGNDGVTVIASDKEITPTQIGNSKKFGNASGGESAYTLRASEPNGVVETAIPVLTPERINKRQNGRRFKENGDPMFTLNTQNKHGVSNETRIRRLTPTEAERLMGLEDGWTAKGIMDGKEVGMSDTQRYKMCGNGVVVNCVDYIYSLLFNETNTR